MKQVHIGYHSFTNSGIVEAVANVLYKDDFMLKWNERFMQYESNKSLEETIRAFEGYVGCVYPHDESSYFICSGGRMKLSYVQCTDGGFYGERRVCRMLCDGEYVMPKPSKEVVTIADALEKKLHEDLRS